MSAAEILFIALPSGDMPFVFPTGAIDLVHRLGRPVRGYYPADLDEEAVRKARVAVMPVHWFYSLKPAFDVSRKLKAINPDISVVAGGYTAGAYPHLLLERSAVDYVIRGDAERPFVLLAERLLAGERVDDVPNLTWADGETPLDYRVDEKTLGESNNRDISWFPEFERAALKTQSLKDPAFLFPWVVVSRGCSFHCPECFASQESQRLLAGRGMVVRPPEAVRADLQHWSSRPDIRWCYFTSDFLSTIGPDWAERAVRGRYDLSAYYEWYRVPKVAEARWLLEKFQCAVFGFFHRPGSECAHVGEKRPESYWKNMLEVLGFLRNKARVLLYVTPNLAAKGDAYWSETRRLASAGNAELKLFDETLIPPIAEQNADERLAGFERLAEESRSSEKRIQRQHRVMELALLRSPRLFRILWRVSSLRVAFRMILARYFRGRFLSPVTEVKET